jgi:N4-gp56 family major capsid protein
MAIETASTLTTAGGGALITKYYDKLFLRIAEENMVHKQLGQLNRKIGKGEGGYGSGQVQWTRFANLTEITSGTGEGVPTTAVTLTATSVTGTTAQYDNAVAISDILAYSSFGDVMKAAIERLAYNAGISIDSLVKTQVYNSGTAMNAQAAAHYSSVTNSSSNYLLIGTQRRAVRRLLSYNAPTQADGYYVAVIHPDQLYDLQGDTTTGGWIDAMKYADSQRLLNAEAGKLMGVRYLVSTNAATVAANTAYAASATYYVASFFGRDAFGITELQGLRTYVKGFGSAGTGDPTDKIATAGWKTTFGAASLNSEFYINMMTMVSSTA